MAKLPIPTTLNRRSPLVAVAAILAAATFGAATAGAGDTAGWNNAAAGGERVTALPRLETRLLTRINDVRRAAGLAPLRASAALAVRGPRAVDVDGRTRLLQPRFVRRRSSGSGWRPATRSPPAALARRREPRLELAGAQRPRALELWLNSPPHRQNLLTAAWREVGIAAVHASSAPGVYAGQDVTILHVDFGVRHAERS